MVLKAPNQSIFLIHQTRIINNYLEIYKELGFYGGKYIPLEELHGQQRYKIRVILPVTTDAFTKVITQQVGGLLDKDFDFDVVTLDRGHDSVEDRVDEFVNSYAIVEQVRKACTGPRPFDGVYVNCFGSPAVGLCREMFSQPVCGGFEPAVLMASELCQKFSIITVEKKVVPLLEDLTRRLGISQNVVSIRVVNIPVVELRDEKKLFGALLKESLKAVKQGAWGICLGCTGMFAARPLEEALAEHGYPVTVIDPTVAALGYLQSLIRGKTSHSRMTYPYSPQYNLRSFFK